MAVVFSSYTSDRVAINVDECGCGVVTEQPDTAALLITAPEAELRLRLKICHFVP